MATSIENSDRDQVFAALADKNRRKVIELLHQEDSTLLELSEFFPISFQALSKHIQILEKARILSKKKQGKYRVLSLNRDSLRHSLEWISYYSSFWEDSFDRLDELIHKNRPGEDAT